MDSHTVDLTPERSHGSVALGACMHAFFFFFNKKAVVSLIAPVNVSIFILCFSIGSWGSMFSVVPTICFGFQVGTSSDFNENTDQFYLAHKY